jgi:regulatory protein
LLALRHELKAKGLDESTISEALEGVDEEESAYTLARQRAERQTGLEPLELRRKLGQYLSRRGFSYSVVGAVLRRIEEENEEAERQESGL